MSHVLAGRFFTTEPPAPILQFFNVVYHIDWCADIKLFLPPWDKSHLTKVYDPFNIVNVMIWFPNILLRIFASMIIHDVCVCAKSLQSLWLYGP